MSEAQLLNHRLAGSRRGNERATHDYKSVIVKGNLDIKKKKYSGKPFASNLVISRSIKMIVQNFLTATLSIHCHAIRLGKVTRDSKSLNNDYGDLEMMHLPVFCHTVSTIEMHVKLAEQHTNEKNCLEMTLFFQVAKRATYEEENSLKALECNVMD